MDFVGLIGALVRRLSINSAVAEGDIGKAFNILTDGLRLDVMFNAELLATILGLVVKDYDFDLSEFRMTENSGAYLSIKGTQLGLGVKLETEGGYEIALDTTLGLDLDFASTDNSPLLSTNDKLKYTDISEYVYNICALAGAPIDMNGIDTEQFKDQNVTFSVNGMLYFDAEAAANYGLGGLASGLLGSLLNTWIEDLIVDLAIQQGFNDGVAFRLAASVDLAALDFGALTADDVYYKMTAEQIKSTADADKFVLVNGAYVAYNAADPAHKALHDSGEVYGLENKFLNFLTSDKTALDSLQLALELLERDSSGEIATDKDGNPVVKAGIYLWNGDLYLDGSEIWDVVGNYSIIPNFIDAIIELVTAEKGNTAAPGASEETAVASANSFEDQRTAVANLILSNEGLRIAVTKSIISLLFGILLPDLGGIDEVFDNLEIGIDLQTGKYLYTETSQSAEGTKFIYLDKMAHISDISGAYISVMSGEEVVELRANNYVFYTKTAGGDYEIATSLVDENTTYYIYYGGEYVEIIDRYSKLSGYVVYNADEYDALKEYTDGKFYTRSVRYASKLDEFYLGVNVQAGVLDMGLKLGGLGLSFDKDVKLLPDYIEKEVSHDGTTRIPLLPFYDSVVTVTASVEFELGITEGVIDVGAFFAEILGDLSGVVIEMPSTAKGYSSAHFRLDATVRLDILDLTNSEVMLSLVSISETGAEIEWLAVYYMRDTLYLDLSFFNFPLVAVPATSITNYLTEMFSALLNSSIYDNVVAPSSSEALAADENAVSAAIDESLTTDELIARILISNRRLALSVGNYLMRYILGMIKIGEITLADLVYKDLYGSLDVSLDLTDKVNLEIGAYLALEGDRYNSTAAATALADLVSGNEQTGSYYLFAQNAKGLYTNVDEEAQSYRVIGSSDSVAEANRFERREIGVENGALVYYTYAIAQSVVEGTVYYAYNATTDAYTVIAAEDVAGFEGDKYVRTSNPVTEDFVYIFVPAADANVNNYDMEMSMKLAIKNFDVYFTAEHEYSMSAEDLAKYHELNSVDTVKLSETISLDLLFKKGSDIDLTPLLEYLFPGNIEELNAIISAIPDGDSEQILRNIELIISAEFKLGAFTNYMRQLAAGNTSIGVDLTADEFDILTFVKVLIAVIKNDALGLEAMLDFVNASVEIVSYTDGDRSNSHKILGVYLLSGEFRAIENGETVAPENRYSHYFRADNGKYGYVDGQYKLISTLANYNGYKYAKDNAYCYPNPNGEYVREGGGLYVDLSYFGQPGIYIALSELQSFIGDLMNKNAEGGSEALAAETPEGENKPEGEEGGLNLTLPLISSEIAGYIQMFAYGIRMTSTYIQILANADYINQLLAILIGETNVLEFGEQIEKPYLKLNTDFNNYHYASIASATTEQIGFSDYRFVIEESANGLYWLDSADGTYKLRAEMTEAQKESYEGVYYDIANIAGLYLRLENGSYVAIENASRTDKIIADTYSASDVGTNGVTQAMVGTYKYFTFNDGKYAAFDYTANNVYIVYADAQKKPVIELQLFLWEYEVGIDINLPEMLGEDYTYTRVEEGKGDYEFETLYTYYQDDEYVEGESKFFYYRGNYFEITVGEKGSLYVLSNGKYLNVMEPVDYTTGGTFADTYYVLVSTQGYASYERVEARVLYNRSEYGKKYYAVEGGSYVRNLTTSLITVPECFVDYNAPVEGYVDSEEVLYLDIETREFLTESEYVAKYGSTEGAETVNKNDVTFVRDVNGDFISVNGYKAKYANDDEKLAALAGMDKFAGQSIKYVDTETLYYLNLTIRGSFNMGVFEEYLTEDEWNTNGYGKLPTAKYKKVGDDFVLMTAEEEETYEGTVYYRHTADAQAVKDVLSGIFGELSSDIYIGSDFSAEILFEIRVNIALGYKSEDTFTSLFIAELDLALDVWRRENDSTLTHIIGIYYDGDVETGGGALYADLTWLLGSGAKFKVDLSAYTVEELLSGVLQNLLAGNQGDGAAEALAAGDVSTMASTADSAFIMLNIYSRAIALKASVAFLNLIIKQVAPDMGDTISEILPNLLVSVEIGLAPYDITIGATLYDVTGKKGLLNIGLTLNLFNNIDKQKGTVIDFGSFEEFKELNEKRYASESTDYIFYYGLFTRIDDNAIGENVYVKDPNGGKGYVKLNAAYPGGAPAGVWKYAKNTDVSYVPVAPEMFDENEFVYDLADYDSRYAQVNVAYEVIQNEAAFNLAVQEGRTVYFYKYDAVAGTGSMVAAEISDGKITNYAGQPVVYGETALGGKLYTKNESVSSLETRFVFDANGAHKQSKVFNDYAPLLALDLNALFNAEPGTTFDIVGAIAASGLETIELNLTLDVDMNFSNIINWSTQMSRFFSSEQYDYLKMVLASVAKNQTEFMSTIGGTLVIKAYVNVQNVVKALGSETIDIKALLAGAQLYIEFYYNTNYHGDMEVGDVDISQEPLRIWVAFNEDTLADIYIDGNYLSQLIEIVPTETEFGNFFDLICLKGLDIFSMLNKESDDASGSADEALLAEPEENAAGDIVIDVGDANTGILPENVWGILDAILGQLLIANDMLSIGLAEAVLGNLIRMFTDELQSDAVNYLPHIKVTDDETTSGINILFGGAPSVQVRLGFVSGMTYFANYDDITNNNEHEKYIATGVYGTEIDELVGATRFGYDASTGEYTLDSEGKYILMSTDEYALAAFASSEFVWLGDRYEFKDNGDGIIDSADFAPVATEVAYATAFQKNDSGLYGKVPEGFPADYEYHNGTQAVHVDYVGTYMLVSEIERVMRQTTPAYVYEGERFNFVAENVVGEYLKLGDFNLVLTLDGLGIYANREFSAPSSDDFIKKGEDGLPTESYVDIKQAKLRLSTSFDVSYYGNHLDTENNVVDLSELLDLIFGLALPDSGLTGNELKLRISGALGSLDHPYCRAVLNAFVDMEALIDNDPATYAVELALEIKKYDENGNLTDENILAVYLYRDSIYIDLAGLLGKDAKLSITNLGVEALLGGVIGGLFGVETATDTDNASGSGEAMAASISDAKDMIRHNYAYLAALVNPGEFTLQISALAVNAIIARIAQMMPDNQTLQNLVLPDFGDVMLKAFGNAKDGAKLALNIKLSEGFVASVDINNVYIGTKQLSDDNGVVAGSSDYRSIFASLVASDSAYKNVYDVASGNINLLNLGVKLSVDFSMTSSGLTPGQGNYDSSLAGWAVSLIKNLINASPVGMLGSYTQLANYNDALAVYNAGRPLFTKSGDGTYVQVDGAPVNGTTYYRYDAADIDVVFAKGEVKLTIDITADINLAAVVLYGIGGILYSDLSLDIKLSEFGTTFLSVYYLGSSRLDTGDATTVKYHNLVPNGKGFNDAIYIDATSLGLGLVKFQGISGVLGGNIGGIYDAQARSAGSDEAVSTADTDGNPSTGGVSLEIQIADGYVGLSIDKALIESLLSILKVDLGAVTLPEIQTINIGLSFGDEGISQVNINGTVDGAGTGLAIQVDGIQVSFDHLLNVNGKNGLIYKVSSGYTGLTYPKLAGTMTLIQNVLDAIDPSISISILKKAGAVIKSTSNISIKDRAVPRNDFTQAYLTGDRRNTTVNDGSGGAYRLCLNLNVYHPYQGPGSQPMSARINLTDTTLMLDELIVTSGFITSVLEGFQNPISIPLELLAFGYTDPDTGTWSQDSSVLGSGYGTTASEAVSSSDAKSAAESYTPVMDGLISKVTVNMFTSQGYQPYLSTMNSNPAEGTNYISVKIEFGKDAFNEILIMLHLFVLSMTQEYAKNSENWLYPDYDKVKDDGTGLSSNLDSSRVLSWDIDALVRELNGMTSTEAKVNKFRNYARSIPYALIRYLVGSGSLGITDSTITFVGAQDTIGNISALIGSIFPLPFADYNDNAPNPSANIYIDLYPQASVYGLSARTVTPGIQAIELMVNGEKSGAGTNMSFYNGNGGRTNSQGSSSETLVLTINPWNLTASDTSHSGDGVLEFVEANTATILGGSGGIPSEVVITDIGSKTGTANGQSITLNGEFLANQTFFPRKANVSFANGQNSVGGSGNDALSGTTIVWDASSVDLTAAKVNAANGRRLAGYIYGYALNVVVAAVPVYVTNDYAQTSVQGYYGNDATGYSAEDISIDIRKDNHTQLPDLVQMAFNGGKTYVFGTQAKDADGNGLMAVLKGTDGRPKTLGTTTDSEGVVSDILNSDNNNYKLIPAYEAAVVRDAEGNIQYERFSYNGTIYEYVKLDYSKLPNGSNFPVGVITWKDDNFTYEWKGETAEIDYTYQWGYSATCYGTLDVTIKDYRIDEVTNFSGSDGTKIESFDLNSLTIESLLGEDIDISNYINKFNKATVNYINGTASDTLSVKWDLTALTKRLEEIAVRDTNGDLIRYDYYKGIDVEVTALLGGSEFYLYRVLDILGADVTAGMKGEGVVSEDGKFIEQKVKVRIVVSTSEYSKLDGDTFKFDPYSSAVLDGSALAKDGSTINVYFKGNTTASSVVVGTQVKVTAPYTLKDNEYTLVEGEALTALMKQISYKGYTGAQLYARLELGDEFIGEQTVYVPVEVLKATANSRPELTVTDTFNPEWYNDSAYEMLPEVRFAETGVGRYQMKPDWSTVKYYTNITLAEELPNIYAGGTIYATVEASVVDADGNPIGNVITKVTEEGVEKEVQTPQLITVKLNVTKKTVSGVYFYNGTDKDDIASYNSVAPYAFEYGGTVYSVRPYESVETFFTSGEWNNTEALGKVVIELGNGNKEFAYISEWNLENLVIGKDGGQYVVSAVIGGQSVDITVNVPRTEVGGIVELDPDGALSFYTYDEGSAAWTQTKSANVVVKDGVKTLDEGFFFDVNTAWATLSETKATLKFVDADAENSEMYTATYEDALVWIDTSAPSVGEVKKEDGTGLYYVERAFTFLQGDLASETIVAKVYLVNFAEGETALFDFGTFDTSTYNLFDSAWTLPDKATIAVGSEKFEDVAVEWSAGLPTAEEIAAGKFERTAIHVPYTQGYVFNISGEYAFDFGNGITATYGAAFGALDYTVDNADKFFAGLSASGTVNGAEATFDWGEFVYGANKAVYETTVKATVNGVTLEMPVTVNVTSDYVISKIADVKYRSLTIDPFQYSTFADAFGTDTVVNVYVGGDNSKTYAFTVKYWGDDALITEEGGSYKDHMITLAFVKDGKAYAEQQVNAPLMVISRAIENVRFVFDDSYTLLTVSTALTTVTYTYTNADGALFDVIYTKSTMMPEQIVFRNPYGYYGLNSLPGKVEIVFAGTGEIREYAVTYTVGDVDQASGMPMNVKMNIVSDGESGNFDVLKDMLISTSVKSLTVTRYNSTIAADDLVTLNNVFGVYGTESYNGSILSTPYDTSAYADEFTLFVDGMFVTKANWDSYYSTLTVADGSRALYSRLASDNGEVYYYSYSNASRSYELTVESDDALVFIYSVSGTVKIASWNAFGIKYTYAGGIRYATARVSYPFDASNSVNISVPVQIVDATIISARYNVSSFNTTVNPDISVDGNIVYLTSDKKNYFDVSSQTFYFDPFSGIDVREQVKINVSGREFSVYKYFPLNADIVTAGGATGTGTYVTWDLSSLRWDYEGGSFTAATSVIAADTGADFGISNPVKAQTFRPLNTNIRVASKVAEKVTSGANSSLVNLWGYAGNGVNTITAIDPYTFNASQFASKLPATLRVDLADGNWQDFSTSSSDYKLEWSLASFNPTYLGGRTYVTANLTGPDGSTQAFRIPFLVQRVLVTNITGTKGGLGSSVKFGFDANGVATSTYEINPYNPASQKLPVGYSVTFSVSNPTNYEGTEFGTPSSTTRTYDYIAVAMPSYGLTVENAKKGLASAGTASMQIDGQQRISIPVSLAQKVAPAGLKPTRNGNTLTTSIRGYSVVWYGTASVSYGGGTATYTVMFASPDASYTIPAIKDRSVTYDLTAYIGAIVDASGRVLDLKDNGEPNCQYTYKP